MNRKLGWVAVAIALVGLILAHKHVSRLWAAQEGQRARVLITQRIDETRLITLRGSTRPEARVPEYDRGRVANDLPMEYMLLQLKRPPELEHEFEQYIDSLTDKSSPNFHHWLTAEEQGQQYGLAQEDLDAITGWLWSHGFTVDRVYPNNMVIAFSGNAGEILGAFHTEIHYLEVNGEQHFANMSDPQIPEALAPAVVGVVSMHNFRPHAMSLPRTEYNFAGCGSNCYALVPGDFQTIYNVTPLFRLNILGQGQTIAIVEDSDTYGTDVNTYRTTFGLVSPKYSGTVTTIHPSSCADPGTNAADGEADLDAEVASAMAPDASIEMATCTDTATFGGLIAIQNLVAAPSPPSIISMSYGVCEAANYLPSNAAFNTAFQSAAAAGVSVFASSGDAGASSCAPDFTGGSTQAYPGIGVTGWGESVYNVSVGGTDFEDLYNAKPGNGGPLQSTYWNSTNSTIYGSAKSYIPEIPWNDSCASYLVYNFAGSASASAYCATSATVRSTAAGGGGPSGCATGGGDVNQTSYLEVDGMCAGYPKPAWQTGIFGNPADGVRDVPDVALFASNGIWGHYVIVCYSDTANGGTACTAGNPSVWSGFGGTSVAAPMMASIQALVNQKWGTAWQGTSPRNGNPNPIYYKIAKNEFGAGGNSACYSINQPPRRGLATACAFYDITQGDTDVDCAYNGTAHRVGCYRPSGTYGAVSTQALTSPGTVITGGSGYTSNPTCSLGAPSNLNKYLNPAGGPIWAGGTQASCTASAAAVGTVTLITNPSGWGAGRTVTIGSTMYTFVTSLTAANQVLLYTASTLANNENRTAQNLRAAIDATSSECYASPCYGTGTTANASVAHPAVLTTNQVGLTSSTTGPGSNFTLSTNYSTGITVSGGNNGGTVTAVTITGLGQGYAGGVSCTLTGGGGSGATCSASPTVGTAAPAYQPAYGATPGWDFATGIGSVNAYNLVFNSAW